MLSFGSSGQLGHVKWVFKPSRGYSEPQLYMFKFRSLLKKANLGYACSS